ncbi:hypothetical protein PG984_000251 [Apiospora sp. TS-2023a]
MGQGYDLDPAKPEYTALLANLPKILRMSVLCFYRRLFVNGSEWMQKATWVMMAVVTAWFLSFALAMVFTCTPIRRQWIPTVEGHCINSINVYATLIITNILTDLVIIGLPVRAVWTLQMRKLEKAVLMCCFGLGLSVCAISVVRVNVIFNFEVQNNITGTVDQTFLLSVMECYIAIISISLRMLRPFYRRWRARHSSKLSDTPGNDGIVTFGQGDPNKKTGLRGCLTVLIQSQWELEVYEDTARHDASSERRLRPVNRISDS